MTTPNFFKFSISIYIQRKTLEVFQSFFDNIRMITV